MKKNQKKASAVIQLLDLVWNHTNQATPHSWERLNHAMRKSLTLAVGAGFEFEPGDMAIVLESAAYRSHFWIGESSEWVYALAVTVGNMSAITDYEAMKCRPGFIADQVEPTGYGGGEGFLHLTSTRQRERLAVGFTFPWKGKKVTVTSIGKDALTACSYKAPAGHKIEKRFTITREDILTERAEQKERRQLTLQLESILDGEVQKQITATLGVKNRQEFNALPIKKIRACVAKFFKKGA